MALATTDVLALEARLGRRLLAGLVAVALSTSASNEAHAAPATSPAIAPASASIDELRQEAVDLARAGDHVGTARAWEQLADRVTEDDEARMLAYLHAHDAWAAAHDATGDVAHLCAARAIVARALADDRLDARAHDDFERMMQALDARGIACPESSDAPSAAPPAERRGVPLLAPTAGLSGPAAPPLRVDAPRRRPHAIAGGISLALAAPALGGTIFATLHVVDVTREIRTLEASIAAKNGEADDGDRHAAAILHGKAYRADGLAIGFGLGTAVLAGIGVGLLVHARRRTPARPLALVPHGRPDLVGLTVRGRF